MITMLCFISADCPRKSLSQCLRWVVLSIRLISLVCATFLLCGCSISHYFIDPGEKIPDVLTILNPEKNSPPVHLEISQAIFDGQKLHLKVYFRADESLDPLDYYVVATGLKDSKVIEERIARVSDYIASPRIEKNTLVALRFELSASDLSEYQVRCSWGEDAKKLVARHTTQSKIAKARLSPPDPIYIPQVENSNVSAVQITDRRVETDDLACQTPPCDRLYTVTALVVNKLPLSVTSLELAAGLFLTSQSAGKTRMSVKHTLEESEERISLGPLVLPPGGKKKIRISFNRPIPANGVVPRLRVLRYTPVDASALGAKKEENRE